MVPPVAMVEVSLQDAHGFMVRSLEAVGTPRGEARAQADLLLHADVTGHFSHGLNRLEFYINDIIGGGTIPTATPVVLNESPATAWVDGGDALGATTANFCMALAIKKAKAVGVGWVSAKRCNHFGMAGFWAQKAEQEGLIGMAFTNSSPIMVPTRSKQRALGTNPLAMAAPATNGDRLVVDMASRRSHHSRNGKEMKIHNEQPIPEGWALGVDGKPTTSARDAYDAGLLLPLGGSEGTSGYKGYALASMVELFCSGLSGSKPAHEVRSWSFESENAPSNLGQCFVVIDPGCFAPGFADRVAGCLSHWRGLEPVDPSLPVLAPGDKERLNAEQTKQRGSIFYPAKQIESCNAVARRINVEPIKT